jgi:hypothetical protein
VSPCGLRVRSSQVHLITTLTLLALRFSWL